MGKQLLSANIPAIPIQSGFEYKPWAIIKDGKIEMAHWEFIPPWVKDPAESRAKFNTLNATSERLFESKMFAPSAKNKRCLVVSSGFYEWRHYKPEGAKKEIAYPYFIFQPGADHFLMAGIWSPWLDKSTGEVIDTFAIVTTAGSPFMASIHNKKKRMPTILSSELAEEWISDIPEERVKEIAGNQHIELEAFTISKDFRIAERPQERFIYNELPPLEY